MVITIGSFFLNTNMKTLLFEHISKEETIKMMKRLYRYMKKRLKKIDRDPKVFFNEDQQNADDFIGKTGYYDPKTDEIHLFITDRHPKDILRSFAHEVIHHEQNCSGYTATIDMSKTTMPDYASQDGGLRKAEEDAFRRGNLLFRDWTDTLKKKRSKGKRIMNEKKDLQKKTKKKLSPEERAKKMAKREAKLHMKHFRGKDLEELEEVGNEKSNRLKESKKQKEANQMPHPELFKEKERALKDAFEEREKRIYEELLNKFGIKKENTK